jgi:hypothetical protein
MNEPTQELIVSELRRRVRVSMAELTQVLGRQFASVLPQENPADESERVGGL